MRKALGILNIIAGALILFVIWWYWASGLVSVESEDPKSIIQLTLFLLAAGTSLAAGTLVLIRRQKTLVILAAVNIVLAMFVLVLILPMSCIILYGD